MPEVSINLITVLIAGISAMVVGYIWYGPLFGKTWVALVGKSEEELKAGAMQAYVGALVVALVTAYVLAYILGVVQADTSMEAIQTAFCVWLGFIAAVKADDVLFEGKRKKLYAINVGYHLVQVIVMALIIVMWG